MRDIPIIPTTEGVDWYQYNTEDLAGWPTQEDPYAQPAAVRDSRTGAGAPAPQAEGLVS